jgi:hypothetical protein
MVRKGFKRADGWLLYNSLNVNKNSLKQQTVYEVVTRNELYQELETGEYVELRLKA